METVVKKVIYCFDVTIACTERENDGTKKINTNIYNKETSLQSKVLRLESEHTQLRQCYIKLHGRSNLEFP